MDRSYSKKRERNGAGRKKGRPVSVITVCARPGRQAEGLLRFGGQVFRCALGRSGISVFKREGDGATPLARMRLCRGYIKPGITPVARTLLPMAATRDSDGWCDAVFDRNYNRPVRLPYARSAERMLRKDQLYDVCVVLDWNIGSRRQGRGSAIFLHIAHPDYAPTEGCVAVSPRDMARILPLLSSRTALSVLR